MKLQVAGSTLVNVQVPVLAGLIITAEVGIFLLLALVVREDIFLNRSRQLNLILCFTTQIENVIFLVCC